MIAAYDIEQGKLTQRSGPTVEPAMWIDLLTPSKEEEALIEEALGLDIPTREEMQEIELSSRLYIEGDAAFMTATILSHTDGDDVQVSPVTFVLAGPRLVTVRYEDPRIFPHFVARKLKSAAGETADSLLVGLLDAFVERNADILERAAHDIDSISRQIFRPRTINPNEGPNKEKSRKEPRSTDFQNILEEIGRKGDLTSNIRDSLLTLQRLSAFLTQIAMQRKPGKEVQARIRTLARDIQALSDHANFLSQKITFLLDATLGMINIEQNAIIKIFSVAAVVFLPPTLIASIYGMNFDDMPELTWPLGYPFAIGLMILSAILPYLFFKRRGWL
jgi:magnesium transporter